MRHGAGYRSVPGDPGEETYSGGTRAGGVIDGRVEGGRWYKVSFLTVLARSLKPLDEGYQWCVSLEVEQRYKMRFELLN